MRYSGKILISAILFSFLVLLSCTKVEDDIVVPDALPYSAKLCEKVNAKGYNFSIAITYDSLNETDHLELLKVCVDSSLYRNYVKAKCVYFLGLPGSKEVDEITLNNIKYKDAKYIEIFPRQADGNNNGSLDEVLLLEYTDSIVLQMHDHKVSSNIPYYSNVFLREDNHILLPVAFWDHPIDSTQYIVLLKSNRLIWSKAKTCDTLIFFDIKNKNIVKTPVGANVFSKDEFIYSTDSILILYSFATQNNHPKYKGFDDDHCYLIAYRSDGSIIWADTTSDIKSQVNSRFLIEKKRNKFTLEAKEDIANNTQRMLIIDNNNGNILREKESELLKPFISNSINNQIEYIFYSDNKIIAFDSLLNITNSKTLLVNLQINYDKIGIISNNYSYKEKEAKVDINSNGANDFLITSTKNQLLLIDGKTFDILLATPPFKSEINYGIIRNKGSSPSIFICSNDEYSNYSIEKTEFFTIIKAYLKDIYLFFLILLLVVVIFYSFFKISYLTHLYKLLNNKNWNQGIIVFTSVLKQYRKNQEPQLKSINNKALEIYALEKKVQKVLIKDLPLPIQNIVSSTFLRKEDLFIESTFGLDNSLRYLDIKTFYFKIIFINYCIVIITDLTASIKSEILTTSITIAHDAKNQLATIQQNILNLFEILEDNYDFQKEFLSKKKQKIIKKINDSSFTIMKLLFAANVPNFYKTTINFSSFIDLWIEDKKLRFQYEDITFINNIDKNLPTIEVSENQISFLLQCACDNADQAIPKDQKERIIEFISYLNEKYLEIGIKDNGIGINEEIYNSLNSNQFSTKSTGTGLGLKIIKNVVEKHNAILEIQSELNNGTLLIIKFPLN